MNNILILCAKNRPHRFQHFKNTGQPNAVAFLRELSHQYNILIILSKLLLQLPILFSYYAGAL